MVSLPKDNGYSDNSIDHLPRYRAQVEKGKPKEK
jgi:hypothetical protein